MDTTGLLWQDMMNGKAVGNTTAASASDTGTAKTESKMDETKEMFLKLLVAEMQYQDPLQPTDNSEYVKELSQFTQVETLNSVNDHVEQLQAHTLVGKYVEITDSESGKQVEGKVDFVSNNNGTMYVSVDGNLYKVTDVKSVSESNYFENTTMAASLEQMIGILPDPERLTLSDSNRVADVASALNALSPEAYAMVSDEAKKRLADIVAKMDQLKARQAEIEKERAGQTNQPSNKEKTEETGNSTDKSEETGNNSEKTEETGTNTDNSGISNNVEPGDGDGTIDADDAADAAEETVVPADTSDDSQDEPVDAEDDLEDIPTTIVE